jgi:DNA-binding beta-propeller fold protein YncE
MRRLITLAALVITIIITVQCCKKETPHYIAGSSGYPLQIEQIMQSKCAVSGCHNTKSAETSSGLNLTTWESMFLGNNQGAVVVPYWHELSTLFLFTNVHADLGGMATPTMPLNMEPLTKEQIVALKDWIDAGAPNSLGFVKFSDNPNRSKYYIPNQGCDVVAVIDRESNRPMRYIQVGHTASPELPHRVLVSPDKQYWYVIFFSGDVIQKYRASDDSFVAEANIGFGSWNTFAITPDGTHAFIDDNSSGDIAYVDLETMTLKFKYSGYTYPHGTMMTDQNTLYILDISGSRLFILDVTDPTAEVATTFNLPPGSNPHEIILSNDGSKYYITAQGRNEVQVYDRTSNTLITSIAVGTFPQEMGLSKTKNLLFVTCMNDETTYPGKVGSVAILDMNTNTVKKTVFTGFQPHGVLVDDEKNVALVVNRNTSSSGPAPHHSSLCGGRNGSLSQIDLNTLTIIPSKDLELSVDPYAIELRK